jgi:hypothetical protein
MDVPFIQFFTFGIVLTNRVGTCSPVGLGSCINWQKEKKWFHLNLEVSNPEVRDDNTMH